MATASPGSSRASPESGAAKETACVDYSKFDQLARSLDAQEERDKLRRREENRRAFEKRQEERRRDWDAKNGKPAHHGHGHSHGHRGGCMGCGFADPEAMRSLIQTEKDRVAGRARAAPERPPDIPLEERNRRKMNAVAATRKDGGTLFRNGNYEKALAVYERGSLICNGCYGMCAKDEAKMADHELKLDLNIAACHLRLKSYRKAESHCKMALNLAPNCAKAHFRMAQARAALGEYDQAEAALSEARRCGGSAPNPAFDRLAAELLKKRKRAAADRRSFGEKMALAMRREAEKLNQEGEKLKKKSENAAGAPVVDAKLASEAVLADKLNLGPHSLVAQLSKLGSLRTQGLLTDAEFVAAKTVLLAGSGGAKK